MVLFILDLYLLSKYLYEYFSSKYLYDIILNPKTLTLSPGLMNKHTNVNGDKRNGENYTRGVQYVNGNPKV